MTAGRARASEAAALLGSLARVLACWTVLVAGALAGGPLLVCFAGCALIALPRQPCAGTRDRRLPATATAAAVGAALAVALGAAAALAAVSAGAALAPTAADVLAVVLFAPLFEEPLYRGALLRQTQAIAGTGAAILATSLLFALSHVEWPLIFAAFSFGLLAASLRAAGAGLGTLMGLHAGGNAGWVLAAACCEPGGWLP